MTQSTRRQERMRQASPSQSVCSAPKVHFPKVIISWDFSFCPVSFCRESFPRRAFSQSGHPGISRQLLLSGSCKGKRWNSNVKIKWNWCLQKCLHQNSKTSLTFENSELVVETWIMHSITSVYKEIYSINSGHVHKHWFNIDWTYNLKKCAQLFIHFKRVNEQQKKLEIQ